MKIILFIDSLMGYGAERALVNLANYWCAQSNTVVILTTQAIERRDIAYTLDENIFLRTINSDPNNTQILTKKTNIIKSCINNIIRIYRMIKIVKSEKPDVVIALKITETILLAIASKGLKDVVCIGGEHIYPPAEELGQLRSFIRKYTYKWLDAVAALTKENKDIIQEKTHVRRVEIITNSLAWPMNDDSDDYEDGVSPDKILPKNKKILLAVGRLGDEKGYDTLIDVFASLAEDHDQWVLVIVGEGLARKKLTRQIDSYSLQNRVFLPGHAKNISQWYEAGDLYALTSKTEGLGNVLFEAMAHGLPVVSFDCPTGPRNIIRHDVDGLLVPLEDKQALRQALDRMMKNDDLRKRFSVKAIQARERFSVQRVAGLWENLYNDIRRNKIECDKIQ